MGAFERAQSIIDWVVDQEDTLLAVDMEIGESRCTSGFESGLTCTGGSLTIPTNLLESAVTNAVDAHLKITLLDESVPSPNAFLTGIERSIFEVEVIYDETAVKGGRSHLVQGVFVW